MTDEDLTPAAAPAPTRTRSRKGLWIGLAIGGMAFTFLVGTAIGTAGGIAIASGALARPAAAAATPSAAVTDDAYGTLATDEPITEPTPDAFTYSQDTFTIELKTMSKECFGSAGCNIVVKPQLSTLDPDLIPDDASGSLTYEISGGTDGTVTETVTLTGSSYSQEQSVIQTSSRGTKLKVKITAAETYQ